MKLRNKKTGKILEDDDILALMASGDNDFPIYRSLSNLNEEWEDYEENEYYYAITSIKADDGITKMRNKHNDMTVFDKSIGNYFDTKEEAEKAVEKLKTWKRLKEAGFRFNGGDDACISYIIDPVKWEDGLDNDFDLLFGGEE